MALSRDQKKKMEEFIKNTPQRVRSYGQGGGRRSLLSDELLGQIETILGTGILQKYCYQQLNINEATWEGWKYKGRESLEKIENPDDPTTWDDLTDERQRMVYLLSVIESSKARVVTNTWQDMKDMSKAGTYKAAEFILRTLGKKDFEHVDHYYHHGIGQGSEEDEQIKKELAGFMPKTIEELEEE